MGYIKTYIETDPTVDADVKDGVAWDEVGSIPACVASRIDMIGTRFL